MNFQFWYFNLEKNVIARKRVIESNAKVPNVTSSGWGYKNFNAAAKDEEIYWLAKNKG